MEIVEVAAAEGEERVVAKAHQIVEPLGMTKNMTRDMPTALYFNYRPTAMSNQNPANPPGKSADLESNLDSADRIISYWNSSKARLFQSSRKEANQYLATVDCLCLLMENLVVTHRSSAKLVRAQRLMEMSMARLEKEFHRILSSYVDPTMAPANGNSSHGSSDDRSTNEDSSSGERHRSRNFIDDEIFRIDMMPLDAVLDLRSIAKRIVAGGHGRECVRIYRLSREPVIEGCLYRIGVENLSRSNVHELEWGILDSKITKWIRALKTVVRILFASEKRLCDEIFAGLNNASDFCFAEVVKGPTTKLLAFAESVATSGRSTERLFRILDMYDTMSDLMADTDTVFCQESCATTRTQASTILVRLGESALGIYTEFENAIQGDKSKAPISGGMIHPLTRYVMNYLSFLSDYKETLMNIMANSPIDLPRALPDAPVGSFGDLDGHDDELGRQDSAVSMKLGRIIIILQCRLDLKSNLYRDVALSYLFLMNNLQYIVKKVKGSNLLGLLGYGWLRKNEGKVRQFAANYERAAWIKVLNCLRDEAIHVRGSIFSGVSRQALKDRCKDFNCAIEEVFKNHSGWIVPDEQLREELRISISEKLIPAYRFFLESLGKYLKSGRNSEMYVKYTPEGLEAHLWDLFHSSPSAPIHHR